MAGEACVGRTARATPLGLAGMVVIVVAVESTLAFHDEAPRDWMAFTWRHAARAAAGPEARVEVLCVGDSLVKHGVLPRVLGGRLGRPAYSLAVHGGQSPTSFFLFRRALEAGARPRVVVVDYHPNLLSSSPRSSENYWPDLLDARDAVDLAWYTGDPGHLTRTLALRLFPSVKNRQAIRADLLAALRGGESDFRTLVRTLGRNFRENLGARVAEVRAPPENPERLFWGIPDRGRWRPNRANVAYIHRLLALAERSGVTVVWLLPPVSPAWQARREAIGAEGAYLRLVREVQDAHPNLVVVDARRSAYGHDAFNDLTHLHVEGASAFSVALAEAFAPHLDGRPAGGTNWVTVPRFAKGPRHPATEDLEQSRLAVSAGGLVRR